VERPDHKAHRVNVVNPDRRERPDWPVHRANPARKATVVRLVHKVLLAPKGCPANLVSRVNKDLLAPVVRQVIVANRVPRVPRASRASPVHKVLGVNVARPVHKANAGHRERSERPVLKVNLDPGVNVVPKGSAVRKVIVERKVTEVLSAHKDRLVPQATVETPALRARSGRWGQKVPEVSVATVAPRASAATRGRASRTLPSVP